MKTMLVLGATSDLARACALEFGNSGWNLQLAVRNGVEGARIARDLATRLGCDVPCFHFEAGKTDPGEFWNSLPVQPDAALCAIGMLGDQEKARHDAKLALDIVTANFSGLVPILSVAADAFERKGEGLIIGISSVAGDRGRASNYVYGSAKAGFTAFLSGLRNRLAKKGVQVLTVKPGFVDTKMTEDMKLLPALTATPDEAARAILKAAQKGSDQVYVKPLWRPIMAIIRLLPERVFKRMTI